MIPLSRPSINQNDFRFIKKILHSKMLVDGYFQNEVENNIKKLINSKFVAVTQSCTAALEISAILINLKKNDEVIMPSYGFVSVANAIALRGAKPVFVDVCSKNLNIDVKEIEKNITKKTKAIYVIHYAGNSCDIDELLKIKKKYNIYLIEDAAHGFLGKFKNKFLGTMGDIGTYSFHESKNLTSGQGGCISINNKSLIKRANYILDKGTNRKQFINNYKKKIISPKNNKNFYSWVDIGSEYRLSEIASALLLSQIKKSAKIQNKRMMIWLKYKKLLNTINSNDFYLIEPSQNCESTFHIIALIFKKKSMADCFKVYMQSNNIAATFHYVPLNKSKMGKLYTKKIFPTTAKII